MTAARPADALAALVRACLPPGLTLLALTRDGADLLARLADDAGAEHLVTWHDAALDGPAYLRGDHLAFSYRASADPAPAIAAIEALRAHEATLSALSAAFAPAVRVPRPAPAPAAEPGRLVYLLERVLLARVARARLSSLPRRDLAAAVAAALAPDFAAQPPVTQVHLFLQTHCRQACEFCEAPGVRGGPVERLVAGAMRLQSQLRLDLASTGLFDAFLAHLAAQPTRPLLTLTGYDWTRHPRRDALLAALERHPGPLRLQGPSTALSDPALARRVAALPGLEAIATTLQSSDPAQHDAIVGTPGAHARLMAALDHLRDVPIELATILTRRTLPSLPATVRWLSEQGRPIDLVAYIPDRGHPDPLPPLPPLDELRAALTQAAPHAQRTVQSYVGVPLCAVPPPERPKVTPAVRGTTAAPQTFAPACARCPQRPTCPGLPASYLATFGARGVSPL